jgi:FkbM family methyltransferase
LVTLKGILDTFKTTRNWWSVLLLYTTWKPRRIVFRSCDVDEVMNRERYIGIRSLLFYDFVPVIDNGYVGVKLGKYKIFGNAEGGQLGRILHQVIYDEGYNKLDYYGKRVLDIGGYFGETAVLFYYWGASKVVIYEPVEEHLRYIQKNIKVNNLNAEIHNEGIGSTDGYVDVRYDELNSRFGMQNDGSKIIRIRIKNAERILLESKVDIAKFDCEGAESSLLDVSNDVLSLIPQYFIEYHSLTIKNALIEKFLSAGFEFRCFETRPAENVGEVVFERAHALGDDIKKL